MKIALVDDFLPDRENTKRMLCDILGDKIELLIEFEEGFSVLDYIAENEVDVIITDVQMPAMTGIEMAKQVKKMSPDTAIIFCSAHDNFNYIKQALMLDNYGYILKPVEPHELTESLQRIAHKSQNLEHRLSHEHHDMLEDVFRQALFGLSHGATVSVQGEIFDNEGYYILCLFEIQNFYGITGDYKLSKKTEFSNRIMSKIKEKLTRYANHIFCATDESTFAVIYLGCCENEDVITENINGIVSAFVDTDVCVNAYVSDKSDDFSLVRESYFECLKISHYRSQFDNGSVIRLCEIPETCIHTRNVNYIFIQHRIRYIITMALSYDEVCDEVYHFVEREIDERKLELYKGVCFFIVASLKSILFENKLKITVVFENEEELWSRLDEVQTAEQYINWIARIIYRVLRAVNNVTPSSELPLVGRIKQYIDENWDKNISVTDVATEMFYSSNYISLIFKTHTGQSIFDYINSCKIENAKLLLKNPRYKLYQISNKLGYAHSAYFGVVFKRYTGVTPKQYRESITGEGDDY